MAKVLLRVLCVMLFVAWTEESKDVMYEGHWKSPLQVLNPLATSLPFVNLSPWQLLLLGLTPLCLLVPGALKRSRPLDASSVLAIATVVLGLVWGLARGGSIRPAYIQLYPFLTALLFGTVLFTVVSKPKDFRALGLTVLLAAMTRGALVIYFFFAHSGGIDPPPAYMTNHEDSVLFVTALLVILSWCIARPSFVAGLLGSLASLFLIWAITLNGRRLAWIELIFAVGFCFLLLPPGALRRRLTAALLLLAPLLLVYVVVGWGRSEAVFEPLRALSTAGSNTDLSSLARLEEIRNLLFTLSAGGNPLLGRGWGMEYLKLPSFFASFEDTWPLYRYLPHNSLLAVAAFGGFAGLFGMWLIVPVTAFLGTRGYYAAKRPVEKAAGMAAVGILPVFAAQCYGDVGLQQLPVTLFLGVAMAVAGRLAVWGETSVRTGGGTPVRDHPLGPASLSGSAP